MTLTEAAERLGVHAGTLRVQIGKGKLKARKVGRDWHVTPREVERYARENRRYATAGIGSVETVTVQTEKK